MYGDNHRYFLQFMLKNSYVSTEKALEFCKNSTDTNIGDVEALKTFISEINQKISKQELKILFVKCEVTGAESLTLLNTASDDVCKLQNNFTPLELEYFQVLLKEVIIDENHNISSTACLNLSDSLTGTLRKDNAEKLLEKWIRDGYFVEKDSHICLGARCILEFAPYFRMHCKDYYTSCHLCSEPVFTGQTCLSCSIILHGHCLEKYLRKQTKCPRCKTTWNEVDDNRQVDVSMRQDYSSEDEEEIVSFRSTRNKTRRIQ